MHWHREDFRLFWEHKSTPKTAQPEIARETIELIQRMVKENRLRVVHFEITRPPTDAGAAQQRRKAMPNGEGPNYRIRHHDAKYETRLDDVVKETGIKVLRIPFRAPRPNAIGERFLGSVRRECLNHRLVFNERELDRVTKEYVGYFNRARPHQGLGQKIPEAAKGEPEVVATGKISPFPGGSTRRETQERQQKGSQEGKLRSADGKIIGLPVLGGLHDDDRRVA